MSALRIAVKHGFGLVTKYWKLHDYKGKMKVGLSPVGTYYRIAVLLTNCYTYYNANQISDIYGIGPPLIREYLGV